MPLISCSPTVTIPGKNGTPRFWICTKPDAQEVAVECEGAYVWAAHSSNVSTGQTIFLLSFLCYYYYFV